MHAHLNAKVCPLLYTPLLPHPQWVKVAPPPGRILLMCHNTSGFSRGRRDEFSMLLEDKNDTPLEIQPLWFYLVQFTTI